MENCLFCKICAKQIPANIVFEDDTVFAFSDIAPQAPVHILIVPKKHFRDILAISKEDSELLAHMVETAQFLAKEHRIDQTGFRLVINTGSDGGQSIAHLHLHLMGGRGFGWPPG